MIDVGIGPMPEIAFMARILIGGGIGLIGLAIIALILAFEEE